MSTGKVGNRHELDINNEIINAFRTRIRASSNQPVSTRDTIILLAHFFLLYSDIEHKRTTDTSIERVSNHHGLYINNEIIIPFEVASDPDQNERFRSTDWLAELLMYTN